MDSKTLRWSALVLGVALAAPALAQFTQDSPASVPPSAAGAYELTFSSAAPGAPFQNAQRLVVGLSTDGELCVGGRVLSDPVRRPNGQALAIWIDEEDDLEFAAVSLLPDTLSLSVTGNTGTPVFGRLQGNRTDQDTDCGDGGGGGEDPLEDELSDAEASILELAARLYPDLFQGGGALQQDEGFIYRFYQTSGTYIGFREGVAYVLGGPFGNRPTSRGSVQETLAFLLAVEEERESVVGAYDLSVSGSRWISKGGASASRRTFSLEFHNVKPPNPESQEEVEAMIRRTLDDIGEEITGLEISVQESSDQVLILHLVFAAPIPGGFVVNYDVEYAFRL